VFASPGWRTTGTQAETFLIAPQGWRSDLRDRFIDEFKLPKDTQRIDAPTPYIVIIGRTRTDAPADSDAAGAFFSTVTNMQRTTPLLSRSSTGPPSDNLNAACGASYNLVVAKIALRRWHFYEPTATSGPCGRCRSGRYNLSAQSARCCYTFRAQEL
jgi:hypothetical protein